MGKKEGRKGAREEGGRDEGKRRKRGKRKEGRKNKVRIQINVAWIWKFYLEIIVFSLQRMMDVLL